MSASQAYKKPHARILYAQGLTLSDIADNLGVDVSTVSRWKSSDEGSTSDWDAQRKEHERRDPLALLGILEKHREGLAEQGPGKEPGSWADTLYKVQRIIDAIRDEFEDISTQLAVLQKFGDFVGENLSETEREAVQRATAAYLAHLKEEAGA